MDIDNFNTLNSCKIKEITDRVKWESYRVNAKFCMSNNLFPRSRMRELNSIKDIVNEFHERINK